MTCVWQRLQGRQGVKRLYGEEEKTKASGLLWLEGADMGKLKAATRSRASYVMD